MNRFTEILQLDLNPDPDPVEHPDLGVPDLDGFFGNPTFLNRFLPGSLGKLNKPFQPEFGNQNRKPGTLDVRNDTLFFEFLVFEEQVRKEVRRSPGGVTSISVSHVHSVAESGQGVFIQHIRGQGRDVDRGREKSMHQDLQVSDGTGPRKR